MSIERILALVGTVAACVAGATVGAVVQSVPLSVALPIAAGVGSVFIVLSYLVSLQRQVTALKGAGESEGLGLRKVYADQNASRSDVAQAIAGADERVVLLGISHRSLLSDNLFLESLESFVRKRNTELVVFVLTPDCESLNQRAVDEGDSPESFASDVRGSIARLGVWARNHDCEEAVHLVEYSDYPLWRMQIVDDEMMFVSPYPPGRVGQVAQVMRLEPSDEDGSLYCAFTSIIDHLRKAPGTREYRLSDVRSG